MEELRSLHMTVAAMRASQQSACAPSQTNAGGFGETPTQEMQGPSPSVESIRSIRETGMAMTRENSAEPAIVGEQATTAIQVIEPMGSLYEITRLRNIRANQSKTSKGPVSNVDTPVDDFIGRGIIPEYGAEELYANFKVSLNHYLWVGLEEIHTDFTSVRRSSELLTATILTVTALHIPTSAHTFDMCYKEFTELIASSMFLRYHSLDDVRALCIASFWLSEVSWKLSGHATRIATEMNIHQSFFRALEGDKEHFMRARLWYMLYVCDHHASIAYGRPPMIAENVQIREHERYLQSPHANSLDDRIVSQVALMQLLTRVYEQFAERRLPHQETSGALLTEPALVHVRHSNVEIDQWRIQWFPRQRHNEFIRSFLPKGIILYSYFAKLQLNAFTIRGVSLAHGKIFTERKEFANIAISAAASVLTFVMEEEDLRRALVGTPLYVHTMIAFASVFLMKIATKWNRVIGLSIDSSYVWQLIERMVALLRSCVTSERHLLYHIAAGLEKMLSRSKQVALTSVPVVPADSSAGDSASQAAILPRNWMQNYQGVWAGDTVAAWPESFNDSMPDFEGFPDGLFSAPIMNSSLIDEAFDSESAQDVYNLLTCQFSQ